MMRQPVYPTLITLPTELRGERVTVRPYRPDDGPALLAAIDESRVELDAWMAWPPMMRTQDDAVDYCLRMAAEWIRRDGLAMGIFDTATGRYLGGTSFHGIDWRLRSFEIGYWLRTSATGRGYVTETVRLLAEMAFEVLDARRLEIRCDAQNRRSAAVPERLGFVHEGTLRNEQLRPDGTVRDTLVFALTDADYRAMRDEASEGSTAR
jgi:RimJ/RimL family protein N-acetyltransferase